jgi:hypothetical protein
MTAAQNETAAGVLAGSEGRFFEMSDQRSNVRVAIVCGRIVRTKPYGT